MEYPASDPASINSSTVKISRPPGRSAPPPPPTTVLERSEIHQRVGRHDHVERARAGRADTRSARPCTARRRRASRFGLRQHAAPTDRRPTSRRAYGATSGPHSPVPQPASSTSRLFDGLDARVRQHRRDQRRRAVRQLARAWNRSCAAKLSKVCSTNPSDARAGTSRPEHAASMCRAIGSSGSSSSHSSKISTALSTSPSVQCASASSRRASRCFGLSVITLQKQTTASSRPLQAVQQDAEVGVRVDVLGIQPNRRPIRRFRFDRLARAPSAARRDCCAHWHGPDRAQSRAGRRRSPRPACPRSCRTMPRLLCQSARSGTSARLFSISATASSLRPCWCASTPAIVQRVGMIGRDLEDLAVDRRRPRPAGRSAAAGWRSTSLRPG